MGRRRYYRIKPTERSIPNSSIFREVWPRYYLKYVILYVALFCIGYELDFMSSETVRHSPYESGYILLALVCGWQALNRIMPLRMESGTLVAWGIYALLKVLAAVVVGIFTAPLIVLYNIYKLIVEFRRE